MPFNTQKQLKDVDASTFDIVKVEAFHNTRAGTVFTYIWQWFQLILMLAILAVDTYTCVNILVFNRWSSGEYQVYEYKVAKWIFTGCILFRYALMLYHLAWGIHIYRTKNIALAYLNNVAKLMYRLRHYDYHCLFHEIEQEGFFDWACFLVYEELDNALEVLVADTPRQVINILTLRYYATGGDQNNDILENIRSIANSNVRLSVILSLQLASVALFAFFFFKFLLGMLLYIPIRVKVSHRGFRSLKSYCYDVVNDKVRLLVTKNHKSKKQILEEGILDLEAIRENPLLGSESSLDLVPQEVQMSHPLFARHHTAESMASLRKPAPLAHTTTSLASARESPYRDVQRNPFADSFASLHNKSSVRTFATDQQFTNPFADSNVAVPLQPMHPIKRTGSASSLTEFTAPGIPRNDSANSLDADSPLLPKSDSFQDSIDSHQSSVSASSSSNDDQDTAAVPYPVRGVSMYGAEDFK
ncbi:hypothetical protein FT663_00970 [Candidozyma haemuli var. vulneris]|uniref:Uncharacterized protein n=1 Tax=Candidozyma haemuli TaxID=45357 RepID=A0A2V1AVE9_9ASCO|nr:hypothetical protein CXQ85_000786 [[Candida] haemuloni]KAF3986264.1 hypothetical protein FT662_04666 [[Candida] haemuloni var. vulneris]KAF3994865.1 hypothetical protein FT663_00970 [[Candida] haemuloni var. vulneris]PVH21795.1 hypothetical protein CXQ85_000786 [[Candida] haemuloni]